MVFPSPLLVIVFLPLSKLFSLSLFHSSFPPFPMFSLPLSSLFHLTFIQCLFLALHLPQRTFLYQCSFSSICQMFFPIPSPFTCPNVISRHVPPMPFPLASRNVFLSLPLPLAQMFFSSLPPKLPSPPFYQCAFAFPLLNGSPSLRCPYSSTCLNVLSPRLLILQCRFPCPIPLFSPLFPLISFLFPSHIYVSVPNNKTPNVLQVQTFS